jgi:hypothetical protein
MMPLSPPSPSPASPANVDLYGYLRLRSLNVFSAGFALGVLGTYIAAFLCGYRRVA